VSVIRAPACYKFLMSNKLSDKEFGDLCRLAKEYETHRAYLDSLLHQPREVIIMNLDFVASLLEIIESRARLQQHFSFAQAKMSGKFAKEVRQAYLQLYAFATHCN